MGEVALDVFRLVVGAALLVSGVDARIEGPVDWYERVVSAASLVIGVGLIVIALT